MDNEIKKLLSKWHIENAPEYLAEKISANAVLYQQKKSYFNYIAEFIYRYFSEFNYGLSYKLATFCICAAIGVLSGFSSTTENFDVLFIADSDVMEVL